ncbi:hypothetical protein U9M48_011620 [Paspalum notatum var. saurae]|uniref:Reverse transcriptase domain-containing protein n=1 Tax=Paspalum notatum var. saurae TaxID=547442 RepID=A0AAQ3SWP3_PASNO
MTPYDAILGFDWLKAHSPMQCDWVSRSLSFLEQDHPVTLQGLQPVPLQLSAITPTQLDKALAGNDVWAFAIVDFVTNSDSAPIPDSIQDLLRQYPDVFQDPKTLPPSRVYDHAIPLHPNAVPINSRPYSNSPFASLVLLVKKKDGQWRFCVDYRRLNDMTIKNRFPLPIIEEILDELAGSQFFTKLDMRSGYHQIRMLASDEFKTAFKTHQGHYQFRVMPFGLTNAPAIFQCVMNEILKPFLRKFVLVFLDDILIYSPSLEHHRIHLQQVLEALKAHQLYFKPSKCSFAQPSVDYLGHTISGQGVATDITKTAAMQNYPRPTNVTELRGFLDVFSGTSFSPAKQALSCTPVLALPAFQLPFIIETDACGEGIGAVLMQRGQPVAFLSKGLSDKHKSLSIYEKEFLALIMAVEKWRQYLRRQEFTILTDHKSLVYLTEQTLHSNMQKKAMACLMGFQFKIVYKQGKENLAADALSLALHVSTVQPQWIQEVLNSYTTDSQAQQLLTQLAVASPNSAGFSLTNGLIYKNGKVWIGNNSALQTKLIAALHASALGGHSGIQATYYRLKQNFSWPGQKQDVENFIKQCLVFQQAKQSLSSLAGLLQPLPIPHWFLARFDNGFYRGPS